MLGLAGLWDETDVVGQGRLSPRPPGDAPPPRALCQPRGLGGAGRPPSAAALAFGGAPRALPRLALPCPAQCWRGNCRLGPGAGRWRACLGSGRMCQDFPSSAQGHGGLLGLLWGGGVCSWSVPCPALPLSPDTQPPLSLTAVTWLGGSEEGVPSSHFPLFPPSFPPSLWLHSFIHSFTRGHPAPHTPTSPKLAFCVPEPGGGSGGSQMMTVPLRNCVCSAVYEESVTLCVYSSICWKYCY